MMRPFGVSQPFHCHRPIAQRGNVVHELRLRKRDGIAARVMASTSWPGRRKSCAKVRRFAGCGTWGLGLKLAGL